MVNSKCQPNFSCLNKFACMRIGVFQWLFDDLQEDRIAVALHFKKYLFILMFNKMQMPMVGLVRGGPVHPIIIARCFLIQIK